VPLLNVADLFTPATQADVLALELSIATQLGLPTTAWQPLSPEIVIEGVNAQLSATYSVEVSQIAQGGFATSAATILAPAGADPTTVDNQGYLTTWMDLCLLNIYNVTRIPATFANGSVPIGNVSANTYPYSPNQPLHFQNAITGATYTTVGSGSILPGSTSVTVQADAQWIGSKGTTPAGQTLLLITPLSGVAPSAQLVSLIGTDAENNGSAGLRGFNKLGSLSPNGAAQSYLYVATSVATPATQSAAKFPFNSISFTVSAPITRVATFLNTLTGLVGVYIANASGAPSGPDVTAISGAIQLLSTPLAVTVTVSAVSTVSLNVNFNVYIKTSSGLSATQVLNNIDLAIANFCAAAPIGGFTTPKGANYIPYDDLVDVIFNANPGTVDLTLLNPPGDLAIPTTAVPVPGVRTATTANVFFV